MSRSTSINLSEKNLLHNLTVIKKTAPYSRIIAMVKANAYGHGLRNVARRLEKYVFSLGVARIDEALALRKIGIKIPITLMEGVFEQEELLVAASQGFHIVLHTWNQIEWFNNLPVFSSLVSVWIKIDTGMGRLGFSVNEALDVFDKINHDKNIKFLGWMSHFACADSPKHNLNTVQLKRFSKFTQLQGLKSICNSAALFAFPEHQYDVVRTGLALYGISPFENGSFKSLGLKPVMTLQTRLIAVKIALKGSTLGYGGRFVCPEDMLVGVAAIGYGDGYPRSAQDGTPLLINGIKCKLVGRVSMDMITVDLRPCPQAQINDKVTLWGEGLKLEEVARYTHDSPYNIISSIQSRVKCTWVK